MQQPFHLGGPVPSAGHEDAYWFLIREDRLVLCTVPEGEGQDVPRLPRPPFPESEIRYTRPIGLYGTTPCIAAELREGTSVSGSLSLVPLRQAYGQISRDLWTIAGRAIQFIQWNRHHQFCGQCGKPMIEQADEPAKKCGDCGFLSYPRLSPAVIMTVIRGEEVLLGRAPHWPKGMYSPLAGFVEPGETLEDAVAREVMEEVHIEVENPRYVASQPWPFPHSLMVGFTAEYAGGEIQVDRTELEDARWFKAEAMPALLPSPMSIARTLIEAFLADRNR